MVVANDLPDQLGTDQEHIDQLHFLPIVCLKNHMVRLNQFMGCCLVTLRCNLDRLFNFFALRRHPEEVNIDHFVTAASWKHRSFFAFVSLLIFICVYINTIKILN